jgi:DNA-binding response OmpR family regulator
MFEEEIMPKKILIVEDEADAARVLVKRLETNGFNVVVAVDAYQGTAFINNENPDLIILDLMLPAGGGLSVLKNIKARPKVAYTPIIILTGMKDDNIKKEVIDSGVDAYLEKPYDADILISTINKILSRKE